MNIINSYYSSGKFLQRTREFYDSASGLPCDNVLCVAYDANGKLWAGTEKGLAYFDGTVFKSVALEKSGADKAVSRLYLDANGSFWAANGANLYLLKKTRFALANTFEADIVDITACGNCLYVLTYRGIFIFDGKEWKPLYRTGDDSITSIAVSEDNFYVARGSELLALSGKRLHWKEIRSEFGSKPEMKINTMCFDSFGHLWAGTDKGLMIYDNKSYWLTNKNIDYLPAEEIYSITVDADGGRWYGSDCGVIYEKDANVKYFGYRRWVPDGKVVSVAVSADCKTVWAATAKGISCIGAVMMSLRDKADYYQETVEKYHVRGGFVTKCHAYEYEDLSKSRVEISDNDGLWTAKYVASQAFRYAVTGDADALENARRSMNSMLLLTSITGIKGFTARAIRREGEFNYGNGHPEWHLSADGSCEWKCETSSDEMTGHFFGFSIYYDLCANEEEKVRIRNACCGMVDHMIDNNFKLVDYDGKPTTWANWNPMSLNCDDRWAVEKGINSLELLAFLKVAYHMSGDERYNTVYTDLIKNHHYALNAARHKIDDGHTCHIDDNLGFLATTTILRLEDNKDIRRLIMMGLADHFRYEKIERNPLWGFIHSAFTRRYSDLEAAVQSMREIPLSLLEYEVVNSTRRNLVYDDQQEKWGEPPQLKEPLPFDERPLHKYDSSPFDVDGGDGVRAEDGTMYLLPYWFARYYKVIDETEE